MKNLYPGWERCNEDCACNGPWLIDGFIYTREQLSRPPCWPYTTPHYVYHRRRDGGRDEDDE